MRKILVTALFLIFISVLPAQAQFFGGGGTGGSGPALPDYTGRANYVLHVKADASGYELVNSISGLTFSGFTVSQGIESDGSGNLISSGAAPGAVPSIGTFATPTITNPYSLSATNSYNKVIWYGATGEIDLPAAVAGMNILIYNTGAFTITIDPNLTDVIVRDGTAQAAGLSMTLSAGAGNYVTLICDTAGHWVTLGFKGSLGAGS